MSIRLRPLVVATCVPFMLSIGVAHAGPFASACAAEFTAVETAIYDATFLGAKATTNESNLLAKLDAADAKVLQEKPADAIDKLMEISDSATALATAPKPKLDSADGINAAVSAAIQCVGAL